MSDNAIPELQNLEAFEVSIENHIAHITLSRPEALNSMNAAFWRELPQIARAIDSAAAARVIVISSTGKHFSAGMDLSVFANMGSTAGLEAARRHEQTRRTVLELQDSFNALEEVRMPVLVAIHGGCIGGAIDMVSACCSRYCTADSFFNIKETAIGMTADVGTLQRLPHLISHGLVRELAYTSRNMLANEAKACGLVNHVYENQASMLTGVMAIAAQIAANSPLAVAGTKQQLTYTRDHSVADSLDQMATWQSGMLQTQDVAEAMTAKTEKRDAVYDDLWAFNTPIQSL